MRWIAALAVAVLLAPLAPRASHAQQEGDYTIENFHFGDGETLPELRQHWMTLGKPRTDAKGLTTNAVLILHGTTGTGRQFLSPVFAGVLYGPGQLLDTAKYYIILPDAIGHGKSSKPSDGLHAHFPKYDYADMIRAEYEMLTKGLKVNHLLIVMGTSMGGMHSWMWGEMYPDYTDGLMPLASLPTAMSGRNRMMRHMMVEDITEDPGYDGGDYKTQPRGLRAALQLMFMMTSSPRQLQKHYPTTESADEYIDKWMERMLTHEDANDYIYAFEASRDYDPEPKLGLIKAPLIAVNSEDDQVNPPKLGVMERDVPMVKHGQYVLIPTSDATRGHGTHTMAAIWQSHLADLLEEIKKNTGR